MLFQSWAIEGFSFVLDIGRSFHPGSNGGPSDTNSTCHHVRVHVPLDNLLHYLYSAKIWAETIWFFLILIFDGLGVTGKHPYPIYPWNTMIQMLIIDHNDKYDTFDVSAQDLHRRTALMPLSSFDLLQMADILWQPSISNSSRTGDYKTTDVIKSGWPIRFEYAKISPNFFDWFLHVTSTLKYKNTTI